MDGRKIKIMETIHARKVYYLVYDGMDIVGKFESLEDARNFIKQYESK